jgi:catalase
MTNIVPAPLDAIVIADGVESLFGAPSSLAHANSTSRPSHKNSTSSAYATLYPAGRPRQILENGYRWGKPIGAVGSSHQAFGAAGIETATPGVYAVNSVAELVKSLDAGLRTFKFMDRFPLDQ